MIIFFCTQEKGLVTADFVSSAVLVQVWRSQELASYFGIYGANVWHLRLYFVNLG